MLLTFHLILCVLLVIIILLQAGKSGGFTTTFGGSSQSLFGASGAGNFLTKGTTILAVLFFVTSVFLTISVARESSQSIVKEVATTPSTQIEKTDAPPPVAPEAPSTPETPSKTTP